MVRKLLQWFGVLFVLGIVTAAATALLATSFQTLDGTWASSVGGLSIDGAEPVLLEQARDHLRITAPNGALVLRRGTMQ